MEINDTLECVLFGLTDNSATDPEPKVQTPLFNPQRAEVVDRHLQLHQRNGSAIQAGIDPLEEKRRVMPSRKLRESQKFRRPAVRPQNDVQTRRHAQQGKPRGCIRRGARRFESISGRVFA